MSGNKKWLTDVLKSELGFEGFLISDYNALDQLPGDRARADRASINAGMDMVMVPSAYREFIETLKMLVKANRVPMSRIDDAVTRILRVKAAMGLLEPTFSPQRRPQPARQLRLRRASRRRAARRCGSRSSC